MEKNPFTYRRRQTMPVKVGTLMLGSDYPIRLQSMTSTSTMNTEGSAAQAKRIVDAGGELVRLTAQGIREAENLRDISRTLKSSGYCAPLVADIHFNPKAAEVAARIVEKVRINPGNFLDPGRTFRQIDYTDEEYAAEVARIEEKLLPFIELCRQNKTAIRIGVNHGSLSDRIMSRYGNTPAGMAESAMEFIRVFHKHGFRDLVISMKASSPRVMVESVRRLVRAMDAEDMRYPLHLGVTEAGKGEDGRIKSAVGIGALLADGLGDTVRVSLSEAPEKEIPVAQALVEYIKDFEGVEIPGEYAPNFNPIAPERRESRNIGGVGGDNLPKVLGVDPIYSSNVLPLDVSLSREKFLETVKAHPNHIIVLSATGKNVAGMIRSAVHAMSAAGFDNPVIVKLVYDDMNETEITLKASVDFGTILLGGIADGILIDSNSIDAEKRGLLALAILQAAGLRFSHTEYISCPGCGRTLFELEEVVDKIKEATSHLPDLKIGVMGCIVNGPGEMADADYGYVGAAAGKISLYKGKNCVEKNIPQDLALGRLIELLKKEGKWIEPNDSQK